MHDKPETPRSAHRIVGHISGHSGKRMLYFEKWRGIGRARDVATPDGYPGGERDVWAHREGGTVTDLVVFSGRAHPQLAEDICRHLGLPVGQAQVYEFSNENIFVKIEQNVRGKDVFVVQPFSSPVSTSILELLIMIDAFKRASAKRITAVIPYYAYGRTDKKDQARVPITARLLA